MLVLWAFRSDVAPRLKVCPLNTPFINGARAFEVRRKFRVSPVLRNYRHRCKCGRKDQLLLINKYTLRIGVGSRDGRWSYNAYFSTNKITHGKYFKIRTWRHTCSLSRPFSPAPSSSSSSSLSLSLSLSLSRCVVYVMFKGHPGYKAKLLWSGAYVGFVNRGDSGFC
jgi:hypothetical protein